jgi:integrase
MAGQNKLSDSALQRMKLEDGQEKRVSDGGNLKGRLKKTSKGRVCRFAFHYKRDGEEQPPLYIGSWPTMSLPDVRAERDRYRAWIDAGLDPRVELGKAKAKERAEAIVAQVTGGATVRGLYARWFDNMVVPAYKDDGLEVRRLFEGKVLPVIGDLELAWIDANPRQARGLVADIAYKAKNEGKGRTAALLRSYLGEMFRHGMALGLVDHDPTTLLRAKDLHDRAPRQRSLAADAESGKPDEIKPLAEALGAAGLHDRYQAAILVLLATLARVGELSKAEWKHLDLDAGTWQIPEENSKSGEARTIHLSPFAVRQFRRLATFAEVGNPFVLPGRPERARHVTRNDDDPKTHIDEKTLSRMVKDRQRGDGKILKNRTERYAAAFILPGGPWTIHDLRRSGASLLGELGVDEAVVERCLGHLPPRRIVKTYQTSKRGEQQRLAFILLGQELERLIDGKSATVVALPRMG